MRRRKTIVALVEEYLAWMPVVGYSAGRVRSRRRYLQDLVEWCEGRGIRAIDKVTPARLGEYQAWLLAPRATRRRELLTPHARRHRLIAVRTFFAWLGKHGYVLYDAAADIDLPKLPDTVPRHILTDDELARIFSQPDLTTPEGLRDRAVLETLYSTGIRGRELVRLERYDLDMAGGTLMVREGKGGKDRVVPIGERAIYWIDRYLREGRPKLELDADDPALIILRDGGAEPTKCLGAMVARCLSRAGVTKPGRCHLFRHTMATRMLENGADTRYIQEILGHAYLTTTQIYTRVAIPKLQAVHAAAHPARQELPAEGRLRAWSVRVLTPEEVELVFSQPDVATTEGLRDRAILEVLYRTGMRARELLAITRGDVDQDAATVTIRNGGRVRVVPLSRAMAWVARYDESRSRDGGTAGVLFPIEGPRTAKHLAAIVMRHVARAGVTRRDGCDLLRRTAQAHLRAEAMDNASVRALLGMRRLRGALPASR